MAELIRSRSTFGVYRTRDVEDILRILSYESLLYTFTLTFDEGGLLLRADATRWEYGS